LGGDGALAPVVAALSGVKPPWDLSLDRTTWQPFPVAGPRLPWINFLVLAIVHDGVAYPILWTLLPKKAIARWPNASQGSFFAFYKVLSLRG
jgi:hypothetical protein